MLPFAYLSGDPEQEYFTDRMVEEIITALSRIAVRHRSQFEFYYLRSSSRLRTLRASNLITRSTSADAHRTAALTP